MRSPGSLSHSWNLTLQGLQPELELKVAKYASVPDLEKVTGERGGRGRGVRAYPTETKLAHDSPTATGFGASVFDGGGPGVPPERVELELSLVPDLSGERLVSSYVEVRSASDFVRGYAFAGFDVAEDSDFCHGVCWGFFVGVWGDEA